MGLIPASRRDELGFLNGPWFPGNHRERSSVVMRAILLLALFAEGAMSMSTLATTISRIERLSFQLDRERETFLRRVRQRIADAADPLSRLPSSDFAISKECAIAITGATEGIGLEAAAALATFGYATILCARDATKARAAVDYIKVKAGSGAVVATVDLDLSAFESVEQAAADIRAASERLGAPLGGLLLNAGVWPTERRMTADGLEVGFQVNHVSHFALAELLLPHMVADGARIVTTASSAHALADGLDLRRIEQPASDATVWDSSSAYGESKLANVLFARALAQRYPPTRLTSLAVHPGIVATSLFREFKPSAAQLPIPLPPIPLPPGGLGGPSFDSAVASAGKAILDNPAVGLVFKKPEDGCRTLVYALLAPGLPSGSYLSDMELTDVAPAAKDSAAADALWRWTEAWVGAKMSKAKLVSKAAVDPPAEGESWEPFLEQFRA